MEDPQELRLADEKIDLGEHVLDVLSKLRLEVAQVRAEAMTPTIIKAVVMQVIDEKDVATDRNLESVILEALKAIESAKGGM